MTALLTFSMPALLSTLIVSYVPVHVCFPVKLSVPALARTLNDTGPANCLRSASTSPVVDVALMLNVRTPAVAVELLPYLEDELRIMIARADLAQDPLGALMGMLEID